MSRFRIAAFGRKELPDGLPVDLWSIPGGFDIQPLSLGCPYILSTEKAFRKSWFSSRALDPCDEIGRWQLDRYPQLWSNDRWSAQFAMFVLRLTQNSVPPEVIELYPPFLNCGTDIEGFLDRYSAFEYFVHRVYPETSLVLLNRHTTFNLFGYLISTAEELRETADLLRQKRLALTIGVDLSELLIYERAFTPKEIERVFQSLFPVRDSIAGFHLRVPGFRHTAESWDSLLTNLEALNDDGQTRYLVPEVREEENISFSLRQIRQHGAEFRAYP